ncbi:MAG TPA: hypothetical protein VFK57_22060 [Vicinamibacterales bacterium]|nr:hypothetical protein [Vicinamibacterales bacterium]
MKILSLSYIGAAAALCLPAPARAQAVDGFWSNTVNVSVAASTITKTAGCDLCSDAGATSAARLTGDGYVEFVPASGHRITAGLSSDLSASTGVATMNYAFSIWPSGVFEIRELGIYRTEGTFAQGDRLRVAIESGVVVYRRNGTAIHTSPVPVPYPVVLDVTLSSAGASLSDAVVSTATQPVVTPPPSGTTATAPTPISWMDTVKVTASAGSLTKRGGCGDCPDAGAHSSAAITAGLFAEFAPASGHRITAGLSTDRSASTSVATMNYAFSLWPSGAWEIRELGVYRLGGTFAAGDRFRVGIESGLAVYRQNGIVVYTSAAAPPASMTFDVTLSSRGASISGAGIGALVTAPTEPPPPPPPPPPSDPVTTGPYTAITDRLPRAKPAVPVFGAAGTAIVDPVFGSAVRRITDDRTRPGYVGRSYRSPSSPHQNAWSAAGTKFYVVSGDGSVLPFSFDGATGTAQRIQPSATGDGGLVLRFYIEPEFSRVDDALIYGSVSGISGATLRTVDQFSFTTGAYSRLLDLDTLVSGLSGTYIGGVASSAGPVERIMAFFGGTSQDRHHYVVLFDKANPQSRLLLDTTAGTLNGAPVSARLEFSLHHVAIDRSGRYVMLYPTWADMSSTRKAAQSYLWDTATGAFTELGITALPYGHDAFGYGVSVNQDCCVSTTWDAAQWQFRSLATPLQTRDVITNVLTPKEIYLADHTTWNNARPDQLTPFISGIFRAPTSDTTWRAWDDEIIAVQTDAAPGADATVWRFAHHRSDVRADNDASGISFWYEPRPNVSPDGRWVMFTSNWEKTLGTDPTGDAATTKRQDVFVVQLKNP